MNKQSCEGLFLAVNDPQQTLDKIVLTVADGSPTTICGSIRVTLPTVMEGISGWKNIYHENSL
jgi:hypothetical protein